MSVFCAGLGLFLFANLGSIAWYVKTVLSGKVLSVQSFPKILDSSALGSPGFRIVAKDGNDIGPPTSILPIAYLLSMISTSSDLICNKWLKMSS